MNYFVLADCNNFYVSCERIFNPKLENRPVIVLSQNDACIIARSQEAKDLGIQMGIPYFKVKDYCERAKIIVLSSNYQLYGDISERVMTVLSEFSPELEIYSIDEAFLKFPKTFTEEELYLKCLEMRRTVKKWIGIPISLGLAPTKTLAKLANSLAKKERTGIFSLVPFEKREPILKARHIEEIWGIGKGLGQRLRSMSIFNAWDFSQLDSYLVRKKIGVVGERMLLELKGIPCLGLNIPKPKKSICFSRSFGKKITSLSELSEALATYTSKACIKLRAQKSLCSAIFIFLEYILHEGDRIYWQCLSSTETFRTPTNDSIEIIQIAKKGLAKVYKENNFKKCGIVLLDLSSCENSNLDLFEKEMDPKRIRIMETIDSINSNFGKNTITFGSMGVHQRWKSRSENRSIHNTTSWKHLPIVKAN